ncbi:Syd protein [Streptomyces sp. NBRC 110611]|nr:Syd protein [Streptomyces sp. NBRC 110611]
MQFGRQVLSPIDRHFVNDLAEGSGQYDVRGLDRLVVVAVIRPLDAGDQCAPLNAEEVCFLGIAVPGSGRSTAWLTVMPISAMRPTTPIPA